ncbi:alkane 1-monooxygenase [Hydrocarboniphaga sp.]|uniref:alkane 1-monooxygenase n=1 Tax=Hydrocarboniphaga sp. TaxID=2033016 RepID=UPI003D1246E5
MIDYLKYYTAALLLAAGFAGFALGGDYLWLGFSTFAVVTFLDFVLPRDFSMRKMNSAFWAAIPVWIGSLGPIAMFLAFGWRMHIEELNGMQLLGGTLSCGWLALVPGIAAQHEMFHARGTITRTIGRYAQFTLLDGMRDIEHVVYHHIDVSTPHDLSTAPRGTSIYKFTPRAVWGTISYALKAESEALRKRGLSGWNWRHRVWKIVAIQLVFQSVIFAMAGWMGVFCVLSAMAIAKVWTESFSYFQHYGQTRVPGTSVGRRHVWNHLGAITRLVGFELTNHADHHMNSYQPYYKLVPHREGIEMPSVFVCFLAALIPPVWDEFIIKPALKRWDMEYATPGERKLAREQNLAAGWEDWFSTSESWPVKGARIGI